jgi:hypothetical protein
MMSSRPESEVFARLLRLITYPIPQRSEEEPAAKKAKTTTINRRELALCQFGSQTHRLLQRRQFARPKRPATLCTTPCEPPSQTAARRPSSKK